MRMHVRAHPCALVARKLHVLGSPRALAGDCAGASAAYKHAHTACAPCTPRKRRWHVVSGSVCSKSSNRTHRYGHAMHITKHMHTYARAGMQAHCAYLQMGQGALPAPGGMMLWMQKLQNAWPQDVTARRSGSALTCTHYLSCACVRSQVCIHACMCVRACVRARVRPCLCGGACKTCFTRALGATRPGLQSYRAVLAGRGKHKPVRPVTSA